MCGRFVIAADEGELGRQFGISGPLPVLQKRFNAAPGQDLPVVVGSKGTRSLKLMTWGIVPSWQGESGAGTRLINARSESLAEKPTFRRLMDTGRCIIPANGFYEWAVRETGRVPYYFSPPSGRILAFAGVYEGNAEGKPAGGSFVIITVPANSLVAPFHKRMPAILERDAATCWLSSDPLPPSAVGGMLGQPDPGLLAAHQVGRRVNMVSNDDPGLTEAVSDPV